MDFRIVLAFVVGVALLSSTGDAGTGSQNLMKNLQELKDLIPEESFIHAERFVKDVIEVPGSQTHLEKVLDLWREHLGSQKLKSDGADEHTVNNIQENQEESKSESEGQDQQKMDSMTVFAFLVAKSEENIYYILALIVVGVGVGGVVVGVGVSLLLQSTAKVKVYSVVTGQIFGADQVLLDKLKNVETTRDLQESHVVIVFCPITSRVGSDVEAAMTDITGSCGQKPVILVLMHHTRDVDYSTDGKNWSDVYDNVVLDVHVLFHETERGLLTCRKNDQALGQIQKQLQSHSKYKDS